MNSTCKLWSYVYPITLTFASGAGTLILIKNLEAEAYDVNQDSIGLPIGMMFITLMSLTLMHLLQVILLRFARVNKLAGLLLKITAYLVAAVSLLMLVDRIAYWAIPEHGVIAILYGFSVVTFVVFQMQTFARLK